jgi:ferredoxin
LKVEKLFISTHSIHPPQPTNRFSLSLGKTLYETCETHGIELGPASCGHTPQAVRSDTWTEPLYGEGPGTGFDHVLLVGNGSDQVDPITHQEERAMSDYWDDDEIFPESRLATQVIIKKEMDGMVVYVPDRLCDDIP